MKFLFMLGLMGLSLTAKAITTNEHVECNGNLEAEFVAEYDNVQYSYAEAGNREHMSFGLKNIKAAAYHMNAFCPLDIDEAVRARIESFDVGMMDKKNGDAISGILVFVPKVNKFFIQ